MTSVCWHNLLFHLWVLGNQTLELAAFTDVCSGISSLLLCIEASRLLLFGKMNICHRGHNLSNIQLLRLHLLISKLPLAVVHLHIRSLHHLKARSCQVFHFLAGASQIVRFDIVALSTRRVFLVLSVYRAADFHLRWTPVLASLLL
jgi:hypothetical protein